MNVSGGKYMQITKIPAKPKEYKTLRVAAYARVSADKDAAFHSLEAQTEYYEKYVSNHPDLTLVGIYSDNGISGTIVERPEFQRLLEDCRAGKIDLVITKSVTRFARNTVILLQTIRELKALGIDCYFEKEQMHSISPDGELLLTLLAMYAEEEARSASENQLWRVRKRFEQGKPWVGNMLGYRLIDGKLIIIPEEAEIVRQIYADYLSGMGKNAIANKLSRSGITTPTMKSWSYTGICKILCNEKYVGDMILQKTYTPDFRTKKAKINHGNVRQYFVEGSHEPIIDQVTFDAVQHEMERRKEKWNPDKSSKTINENMFSGLIVCGICGSLYKRKHQHCQSYSSYLWLCNKYYRRGKTACPSQKIPESILNSKTKEILNVDSFTHELLEEKLTRIIVPEHNRLIYEFKDGSSVDVFWQFPSRSLSWNSEMRQAARERTLAKSRKEKKEHETKGYNH